MIYAFWKIILSNYKFTGKILKKRKKNLCLDKLSFWILDLTKLKFEYKKNSPVKL